MKKYQYAAQEFNSGLNFFWGGLLGGWLLMLIGWAAYAKYFGH